MPYNPSAGNGRPYKTDQQYIDSPTPKGVTEEVSHEDEGFLQNDAPVTGENRSQPIREFSQIFMKYCGENLSKSKGNHIQNVRCSVMLIGES